MALDCINGVNSEGKGPYGFRCRLVNEPIRNYLFNSGETYTVQNYTNTFFNSGDAIKKAQENFNKEVAPIISNREKQENQRKAQDALIKSELEKQRQIEQRRLEQQQAINKENLTREAELLRQNEEQNIRVASISKEAIKGTQDFATSQGEKLSFFATEAIGTTAQATNQAIETTAESANQSFNFANENLAQNLVFLAIIGGSGFLIYKNKNKLPKIFR